MMNSAHVPDKSWSLVGATREQVTDWLSSQGDNTPARVAQLMRLIYHHAQPDILQWSFKKILRHALSSQAHWTLPTVHAHYAASDGVDKWLIDIDSKSLVECVLIPQGARQTLCISSQAGCLLTCQFCATGKQGFSRNLTTQEIIGQVLLVQQYLREQHRPPITNIVFMGMGEPLLNLTPVIDACRLLRDKDAFNFSWRRVTVSTSGIIPGIEQLAQQADVSLALSLHAPNDALRREIMPINQKYPLAPLLAACRQFIGHHRKKFITMEYIMLHDINDRAEHAEQLAELLQGMPCKINLIPFNPFPGSDYRCSTPEQMTQFSHQLQSKGFVVTIRQTKGQQVNAACGQLAGRIADRSNRQQKWLAHLKIKTPPTDNTP